MEPRLLLAKNNESLPPQAVPKDRIVKCAGCNRVITPDDMQKQLYPEMTLVSQLDLEPGNGNGQKEDPRA